MCDFQQFAFADGHIKSVLIEPSNIKVSYRRWDDKDFDFIFRDSSFILNNISYGDIGGAIIEPLRKGVSEILDKIFMTYSGEDNIPYLVTFFDSLNDGTVLMIVADSVDVIEV